MIGCQKGISHFTVFHKEAAGAFLSVFTFVQDGDLFSCFTRLFTYVPTFGGEVKVHLDDEVSSGGANSFSHQTGLDLVWGPLCSPHSARVRALPSETRTPQHCLWMI